MVTYLKFAGGRLKSLQISENLSNGPLLIRHDLSWVAETLSWSFLKELCNNPPRKICLETNNNG
jgi:hypothetical protein